MTRPAAFDGARPSSNQGSDDLSRVLDTPGSVCRLSRALQLVLQVGTPLDRYASQGRPELELDAIHSRLQIGGGPSLVIRRRMLAALVNSRTTSGSSI